MSSLNLQGGGGGADAREEFREGGSAGGGSAETSLAETSLGAGTDEGFMARALALAARGVYSSHPNPRVGCVVVRDGVVIGEGWHRAAGEGHAEVVALDAAGAGGAKGATLYSTLEPCCHRGRTGACTEAVVAAGVRRVVVAIEDANPLVNGGGVRALREAGVEVVVGVGEGRARELNRGFFKRMEAGMPWVTLKMAASMDGRTALANGESQWITSEAARRDAHKLRAASSAILTGVGTVLRDDPRMTARVDGEELGRQPLRVVLDSNLSTPRGAKILQAPGEALVITTEENYAGREEEDSWGEGVEVIGISGGGDGLGQPDLRGVLRELARREVNELLVEAGPRLSGGMLREGLVDEVVLYVAPSLLGSEAREMFALAGVESLDARVRLGFRDVRRVGEDLRVVLGVG